jgi:hypothetical protein
MPQAGDLIVLVGPPAEDPQQPGIVGGARRFMTHYPTLRLEVMTPADNRSESILRTVQNALAENPRALCLYVSNARAAAAAAESVLGTATILVTLGIELEIDGVFGHVDEDLPGAAELLGKHLNKVVADRRSYMLLHRNGASPTETRCYERFLSYARGHRAIALLDQRNAAEAARPPGELVRAMFRRFPNAGLLVTLEPSIWCAPDLSRVLGPKSRFATMCAAPVLWKHLRSGKATALVGVLDGEVGYLAIETALAAMTESREAGTVRSARAELVTPETLDDFARRYVKAAGLDMQELLSAKTGRPIAPADEPAGP